MLLIFLLTVAISSAQEGVINTIRAHLADVKRWGGRILIAVGLWFIALGVLAETFARVFPV